MTIIIINTIGCTSNDDTNFSHHHQKRRRKRRHLVHYTLVDSALLLTLAFIVVATVTSSSTVVTEAAATEAFVTLSKSSSSSLPLQKLLQSSYLLQPQQRRQQQGSRRRIMSGHNYDNEESEDQQDQQLQSTKLPQWDPINQIYVDGIVPGTTNEQIQQLIDNNDGYLRLFGYGSLCWNPGKIGESALAHVDVTSVKGTIVGYKRCWAQKSTDHRGIPTFPGIVCTLLNTQELKHIHEVSNRMYHTKTVSRTDTKSPMLDHTSTTACTIDGKGDGTHGEEEHEHEYEYVTEGVIYLIPPHLTEACLNELDFREKGGYARDIVTVIEDDDTQHLQHQALLYRGTIDNPAIWIRSLLDLNYSAGTYVIVREIPIFFVCR